METNRRTPRHLIASSADLTVAAQGLQRTLSITEETSLMASPDAHASARDSFLFAALDEVIQVGVLIFGRANDLEESAQVEDRHTRQGLLDESAVWQRKLMELLADAICFQNTPADSYYRDYLLLVALDDAVGSQQDLLRSYGAESRNLAHQIDRLTVAISDLEKADLDPTLAWYRRERRGLSTDGLKPGRLLATFGSKLRLALKHATPPEKVALGLSYSPGFGRVSGRVHARPGGRSLDRPTDSLVTAFTVPVLIGLNLVVQVQDLLGERVPDERNRRIRTALATNTVADQMLNRMETGGASVGDLVVVLGELGEVIETTTGDLGYRSYRVRYLSKSPLEGVDDDWHIGQHVRKVLDPAGMRKIISENSEHLPAETTEVLDSLSDEDLRHAMIESISRLWRADVGLKEALLNHPKSGPGVDS